MIYCGAAKVKTLLADSFLEISVAVSLAVASIIGTTAACVHLMSAGKIIRISLLRVTISFAGKHVTSAQVFKRHANSTYTREEVNKSEWRIIVCGFVKWQETLQPKDVMRGRGLFDYPVV
jgi:ABC-type siderophore export system fused ATPase/permease subunit